MNQNKQLRDLPEGFGKTVELSEADKRFIENYNVEVSKNGGGRVSILACLIQYSDRCGFAQSGSKAYIINTNPSQAYDVTIRITMRGNIEGESTTIVYVPAWGRANLGCTVSQHSPVTYYSFQFIEERPI